MSASRLPLRSFVERARAATDLRPRRVEEVVRETVDPGLDDANGPVAPEPLRRRRRRGRAVGDVRDGARVGRDQVEAPVTGGALGDVCEVRDRGPGVALEEAAHEGAARGLVRLPGAHLARVAEVGQRREAPRRRDAEPRAAGLHVDARDDAARAGPWVRALGGARVASSWLAATTRR